MRSRARNFSRSSIRRHDHYFNLRLFTRGIVFCSECAGLALSGGIAALPRRRAAQALRLAEREEISRGIAAGWSMRQIAQTLGRSPSTISREVRRNGGCSSYRASWADRRAWDRALRPKRCRLARHAELRWRLAQKLALQWSPKQISGWLKQQFPADQGMQVSHETIYRSLFIQTRGALKRS